MINDNFRFLKKVVFSFFLVWVFSACQTMRHSSFSGAGAEAVEDSVISDKSSLESEEAKNSSQIIEDWKKNRVSQVSDVAVEHRPEVDFWIRYFTGRGRDQMKLYLERSTRYRDLMRSVLSQQGLPENLIYMAMIESGFSSSARSRANAVGYWQFIESTGKRYGLKISSFIDERRDPILSTKAASRYLKDLHDLFGSWHLALASYNAGEYRVNRAMLKHYTRNFWKLKKRRSLPKETRHYVPKFMAAHIVSSEPEKYGFDDLNYQPPISYESVAVYKPVSLKKLAQGLGLSYRELKMLNPKYVGEYVPLEKGDKAILRVPKDYVEKVTQDLVAQSFMSRPKYSRTYVYYKVRRGDTLYGLSRRNRTTINTIRRMNRMSSRHILRAGKVIKLPRRYNYTAKNKAGAVKKGLAVHKVRRGESLGRVARRYGLKVAQLKTWNKLAGSIIHPGQVLKLKKPLSSSKAKVKTHIVQKGETLIGIAKKYKVPITLLMERNSLTFHSILGAGRSIIIP